MHLNASRIFAPKIQIVQLPAGLLALPPFDMPSRSYICSVATDLSKVLRLLASELQQWGLPRIHTGFPLRMPPQVGVHQPVLRCKCNDS